LVTASGRFGVPGPFGVLVRSRKGFHAEGAERCAEGSHVPLGPRRARRLGGEISAPDPLKILSRGWRDAVRGCGDLDPEAVLRASFLRGLRVLRVKLRRRDA
jgi:hypothetical protein